MGSPLHGRARRRRPGWTVAIFGVVALLASLFAGPPAGAEEGPGFTTMPTSVTVVAGSPATFAVTVSGDPVPDVSWERSDDAGATWTPIGDTSGPSLSFTAADADHDARFRAVATSPLGSVTSTSATLTVHAAPVVTTHPASALVLANAVVTLASAASGRPAPTVQWQRSTDAGATWVDLAGATASSYSLTATTTTSGHRYRAVFTNLAGTATSDPATVTVGTKPAGSVLPGSPTGMVGWRLDLTAAVTGTAPIAVVWQTAPPGSNTYTNVAGDTSTGVHLVLDSSMNGRKYRIVSTNALGTHTSAARTIAVNTTGLAPIILTQPVAQTVPAGQPLTLSVVSADPSATFQWQKGPSAATAVDIPGAVEPTLTIPAATPTDSGSYQVRVTNGFGTTVSSLVAVQVAEAPTITSQISPTNRSVAAGSSVQLTVGATAVPAAVPTWQRSVDGGVTWSTAVVQSATTGTVTYSFTASITYCDLPNVQYRVVLDNGYGSATSAPATVLTACKPLVTTQPVDVAAPVGDTVSFSATAIGSPTPTVRWQESIDGGTTFTNISGATSPSVSLSVLAYMDGRRYRAVFTNSRASTASTPATLAVLGPPVILTQPQPKAAPLGQSITLSVVTDDPSTTFQWQKGSTAATAVDIVGATQSSFTIASLSAADLTSYQVRATNAYGTTVSSLVAVTVGNPPLITSDLAPSSSTVAAGVSHVLQLGGSFSPVATATWQRSRDGGATWSTFAGGQTTATSVSLTLAESAADCDNSGLRYRVELTSPAGTVTSRAVSVMVSCAPQVTASPASAVAIAGGSTTFSAVASGTPTPTVQWQVSTDGGSTYADLVGATSSSVSVGVASSMSGYRYRAVFTNAYGSATSGAATLTVHGPVTVLVGLNVQGSGGPAFYSAKAWGSSAPGAQWEELAPGGSTWTPVTIGVSGAPSSMYTPPGSSVSYPVTATTLSVADPLEGARYRVVFTVGATTATTSTTVVHGRAPVITGQLALPTSLSGTTYLLGAIYTASPNPETSTWQSATYVAATGECVIPRSLPGPLLFGLLQLSVTNSTDFCVREYLANNVGWALSDWLVVPRSEAPPFTLTPSSAITAPGSTVTQSCSVRLVSINLRISWERADAGSSVWSTIPGTTSTAASTSSYTRTVSGADDGSRYRCVATNYYGTTVSAEATLAVSAPPNVTTDPADAVVDEGGSVAFTVGASGSAPMSVAWEVSVDGGASWTPVPGATGSTLSLVAVTAAMSGNRYRAAFSNAAGSVVSSAALLTVTPADSEAPVVSGVVASAVTPTFGIHPGPVSVQIDATDDVGVASITWSASGATAVAPTTVPGSSASVPVSATGSSTVWFTAVDAAGNVSLAGSVPVVIDPRPVVSVAGEVTQLEPDDGGTRGALVQLNLDRPAPVDVVVGYFTRNGSATGCVTGTCDYSTFGTPAVPRTATIKAGQRQAVVNVPVRSDATVEADEVFEVVVSSVSAGAVLSSAQVAEVTILDVDGRSAGGAPVLMLTPRADVVEGDSSPVKAQVVIGLSKPLAQSITVTYWTADGSAVAPEDYSALTPRSVTLPAGTLSKTVDIAVAGNVVAEGDRWFSVAHSTANPSGVALVDVTASAVVTIVDDDGPAG